MHSSQDKQTLLLIDNVCMSMKLWRFIQSDICCPLYMLGRRCWKFKVLKTICQCQTTDRPWDLPCPAANENPDNVTVSDRLRKHADEDLWVDASYVSFWTFSFESLSLMYEFHFLLLDSLYSLFLSPPSFLNAIFLCLGRNTEARLAPVGFDAP